MDEVIANLLSASRESLRDALTQDVIVGAHKLVGATLVRDGMRARIVETEAYRAEDDEACHAYRSKTPRNAVMFDRAGIAYVYFNYGVHWMLNVTAHEEGRAAAVLIRAAEPLTGLEEMRANRPGVRDLSLLSGPGKLAKAFAIDRTDNGTDLLGISEPGSLSIEPAVGPVNLISDIRIGIKKSADLPWRFLDADRLEWVSRPLTARVL